MTTSETATMPEHGTTRYWVLVGALLIQLILGTIYGYSIFWEPLESTLWPPVLTTEQVTALRAQGTTVSASAEVVPDQEAARVVHANRQSRLKYCFAICLMAFAVTMIPAGRLQDVIGPRKTALIGAALLGVAYLIASQVTRLSSGLEGRIALLWVSIGLIAGVGVGFAYVCPIAALVKWFPRHKGLVSGLAVAGFGFGAYIFSQKSMIGATGYIQVHSVEAFFLVHALICTVTVTIGALLLRNPPAASASTGPASAVSASPGDMDWRSTIRTARFYSIWIMFFSGAMAGLMVIGVLKPFAGAQLVAAAEASQGAVSDALREDLLLRGATAVGVLAIFNAIGRIVWGFVSDKIGRTRAMVFMFIGQGTMLLLLTTLDSPWGLAVGAACVGFNFGGNFSLFPSLTADAFGARHLGANYGWVFTSYGAAGLIGVSAGNAALALTGSYFAAFAMAATLCFFSAILAILLPGVHRPVVDTK